MHCWLQTVALQQIWHIISHRMADHQMALLIENSEVEQLARELASSRGVSVTEAIRQSLENEITRESPMFRRKESELMRLLEISEQASRIPKRDHPMTEDEILGYDELGIPTR
ncbi:type II toxin-antitoxin system VapB family antitoxin [Mesorhizobium sp. LNHC221B00]|uniref:type II toxin-antitoxin system VapB family antitoxin n=1 Tax=Mesorhizobium sp. LNHC221B00 TaxID=1287233 RepID=UPI001FD94861|nr:type II toxin-antitoxin system VapB family antitoxin [Mesorhizobium sp. LNHC221B00]